MIGDQVVGSGRTALDAREEALVVLPNEFSQTLFVPEPEPANVQLPEIYSRVCEALPPQAREQTWLVGGAVRDALMGRDVWDLDFVVAGHALGVARAVADALSADFFPLDAERGVGRVLLNSPNRMVIDFVRMHHDGITADLLARDFTINAMALPVAGAMHLLDPAGGREHLRDKRICMLSQSSLPADPIRAVRAVRLAVELGFRIDSDTRKALHESVPALKQVSPERMRDELFRCLAGPNPTRALRALDRLGVLGRTLPEWEAESAKRALSVAAALQGILSVLRSRHDVDSASEFALGLVAARVGRFRSVLSAHLSDYVVAPRNRSQLLYLCTLLRACCTSTHVQEHCRALRLSNAESDLLAAMAQSDTLPAAEAPPDPGGRGGSVRATIALEPRTIHRFFRTQSDVGLECCLLSLAETMAEYGPALPQGEWAQKVDIVVSLLDGYFIRFHEVIEPPVLINGDELMRALQISQGKRVGTLLSAISEAQAAGDVTTREQALQLARRLQARG